MESAARDIRKKFQEVVASELPIPSSSLLRKAIVSVKRGKVMFSMNQLVQVVDMMMGNLSYILFSPSPKQKNTSSCYFGPPTWTMLLARCRKTLES